MSSRIRRCRNCGRYSLDPACKACGSETTCPVPPKYSPEDRMGNYRRKQTVDSWEGNRSHPVKSRRRSHLSLNQDPNPFLSTFGCSFGYSRSSSYLIRYVPAGYSSDTAANPIQALSGFLDSIGGT